MLQDNKKLKDNLTDMSFKNAIDTKKEEFFTNDKVSRMVLQIIIIFDNIKSNDIEILVEALKMKFKKNMLKFWNNEGSKFFYYQ